MPQTAGCVRFVDTVNVCQYLDLLAFLYHNPNSGHYRDQTVLQSATAAIRYAAQRILTGRPITSPFFDFGLIALGEAFMRLRDVLSTDIVGNTQSAIRAAATDLVCIYLKNTETWVAGTSSGSMADAIDSGVIPMSTSSLNRTNRNGISEPSS